MFLLYITMPITKKKTAPKRKMVQRKRWSRRPQQSLVNRALHPLPQRYITKMKYSEVITTGAISGAYAMNLNSIYDPNRTGVGHQPYAFDTLASLYNRYRVIACGYRLSVSPTTNIPITLTAIPANQVLTTSTASEIRENPRAKYVVQNVGANVMVLSGKSYIPSLVGRSKAQYMADDRYQAPVTSDPQEEAILNIATFNPSNDLALASTPVQVVMEYTVEFFDIKSLGQS